MSIPKPVAITYREAEYLNLSRFISQYHAKLREGGNLVQRRRNKALTAAPQLDFYTYLHTQPNKKLHLKEEKAKR